MKGQAIKTASPLSSFITLPASTHYAFRNNIVHLSNPRNPKPYTPYCDPESSLALQLTSHNRIGVIRAKRNRINIF